MYALLCSLALAGAPDGGACCHDGALPYFCCGTGREVYQPQPGDLYFGWDSSLPVKIGFILTKTGPPSHIGMIVRLPDGDLAIFEATTWERMYGEGPGVYLRPVLYRLRTYQGKVWIRQLRCPLTPEQSDCLTAFALAQVGKPFVPRLLVLLPTLTLPVRTKLGQRLFGPIPTDRRAWFCTEMLVTAAVLLGFLDPYKVKPVCTDPRDMFVDTHLDLSQFWDKPRRLYWDDACPSAR